jgi:hypothetical protein
MDGPLVKADEGGPMKQRRSPSGRVPHDGFIREESDVNPAAAQLLREMREAAERRRIRQWEDEAADRAYLEGRKP